METKSSILVLFYYLDTLSFKQEIKHTQDKMEKQDQVYILIKKVIANK